MTSFPAVRPDIVRSYSDYVVCDLTRKQQNQQQYGGRMVKELQNPQFKVQSTCQQHNDSDSDGDYDNLLTQNNPSVLSAGTPHHQGEGGTPHHLVATVSCKPAVTSLPPAATILPSGAATLPSAVRQSSESRSLAAAVGFRPIADTGAVDDRAGVNNTVSQQQQQQQQQHLSGSTLTGQGSSYKALYAWSPQLTTNNVSNRTRQIVRKSATFCTSRPSTHLVTSPHYDSTPAANANCQMGPKRYLLRTDNSSASEPRHPTRPTRPPAQTAPAAAARTCSDFVDMRGVCRSTLTSSDVTQVEMFYRSNKTEVFVCACAARLYFASTRRHSANGSIKPEIVNMFGWSPTPAVGLPVLVLDSGGSRCRDRKLYVVLAEIGSGFALWRDSVDHLTLYQVFTPHHSTSLVVT